MTVADVVAVVLVHPVPLVGILAFVTVSVFLPLYTPFTPPAAVGSAVMVQLARMLDLKVAPAFGIPRVNALAAMVSFQAPEVLMVSVPPDESVHPVMVGGAESFMVSDAGLVTVPLAENLVHETVIGIESMSPLKVMVVPAFRDPVIVVPAGKVAKAAVERPKTSAPVPTTATTVRVSLDVAGLPSRGSLLGMFISRDMAV
jgi:hypothetical protein